MKKLIAAVRRIPKSGWIIAAVYFGLQYGMYRLGDWLSRVTGTIDRAFVPKIDAIDDLIPLIPVFVLIYLYSYAFWIMGPLAVSLTGKKNFTNYLIGLSAAYIIGFLFFVFMPTYMDRAAEGLIECAQRPGIFNRLLNTVYSADGSTLAFNLFPSYHCLISIYCWFGVRRRPEISAGFRIYSLVMTVLICLSTVFTKQHYFLDIVGGLGIATLCYTVTEKIDPAGRWFGLSEEEPAQAADSAQTDEGSRGS